MTLTQELIDQYNDGAALNVIAKQCGMSISWVRRELLRLGVPKHTNCKYVRKRIYTKFILSQEQIQLYLNGASTRDLEEICGVSSNTILSALKNQGVTVRTRRQAMQNAAKKISATAQGISVSEWKTFTVADRRRAMSNSYYKEWRTNVFQRDMYTCRLCRKHSNTLQAHHIRMVSKYPERMYDVTNGITLCKTCHETTYGYEESMAILFERMLS